MTEVLLQRYFEAWRHHDSELVRQLFAEDATYSILGHRKLRGVEAIVQYWDRNTAIVDDLSCGVHNATSTAAGVVATWSAQFTRTDRKQRMHLEGMLWLEISDGIIAHLTECYINVAAAGKAILG